MTTPQNVLRIAARQIGNTESPRNSNMNKYGAWYGMNRAPWCAMFVSYCFYNAGLVIPITTPKGFAYCPYGVKWFREKGQLFNTPQVGDVVFFDWRRDGVSDHVGIVEAVNANGTITTIEGNTSIGNDSNGGEVMRRNRPLSVVAGFGRPSYTGTSASVLDEPTIFPAWPGYFIMLTTPLMKGNDVLKWQQQMIRRGWNLGPGGSTGKGDDGEFGERSHEVLIKFQIEKGLEADGVLGPLSWDTAWESPITP